MTTWSTAAAGADDDRRRARRRPALRWARATTGSAAGRQQGTRVLGGPGRDIVGGSATPRRGPGRRDRLWPVVDGPALIEVVGGAGRDEVASSRRAACPRARASSSAAPAASWRSRASGWCASPPHPVRACNVDARRPGHLVRHRRGRRGPTSRTATERCVPTARGGNDRITGGWERDLLDGGRGSRRASTAAGSRPLPARRAADVLRAASLTLDPARAGHRPYDRGMGLKQTVGRQLAPRIQELAPGADLGIRP